MWYLIARNGVIPLVGPRGGDRGNLEVTGVEGKRLPPTQEPGLRYELVDKTKHKK